MSGPSDGFGAMPDGCSGVSAEELGRVEGGGPWNGFMKILDQIIEQACLDQPLPRGGWCDMQSPR
jgi:hypothetical protein